MCLLLRYNDIVHYQGEAKTGRNISNLIKLSPKKN